MEINEKVCQGDSYYGPTFVLSEDNMFYVSKKFSEYIPVQVVDTYTDIVFKIEDYVYRIDKLTEAYLTLQNERIDDVLFTIQMKILQMKNIVEKVRKEEESIFKEFPHIGILIREQYGSFKHVSLWPNERDFVQFQSRMPNPTAKFIYSEFVSPDKRQFNPTNYISRFPETIPVKVRTIPASQVSVRKL